MSAAPLLAGVLPGLDALAAAEIYDDPPDLAPLPEEEPLIAKSVAKRRNEFITVRHCARQALGELGVAPVPILKGDKGEPCWPDGTPSSPRACRAQYRTVMNSLRRLATDFAISGSSSGSGANPGGSSYNSAAASAETPGSTTASSGAAVTTALP